MKKKMRNGCAPRSTDTLHALDFFLMLKEAQSYDLI